MEQKKMAERTAVVTGKFYELNEKARKKGLSALKDDVDTSRKNYRDIFEYGILLCVNGIDATCLNKILSGLIKHEKNEQERRFKSIQKEAVLQIKKGRHSGLFLCSLFSYFDIEEIKQIQSYLSGSPIYKDLQCLLEKPFYKDRIVSEDFDNTSETPAKPFGFFNSVDMNILLEHLKPEQPQIIAYVLALIESGKASHILTNLSANLQSEIAYRIAVMNNPGIDMLRGILSLEKKLLSISGKKYADMNSNEFKKLLKAYLLRESTIKEAFDLYEKASGVTAGSHEALALTNRLLQVMQGQPVDFIRTDPAVFFRLLHEEHPKTIACILSIITPANAALMLQFLPDYLKCDAARWIVFMEKGKEVTQEMRSAAGELSPVEISRMEKRLSLLLGKDCVFKSGIKKLVELLCLADTKTEKTIMEYFEEKYPELVKIISDNLFVFEDIVMLDDKSMQKVLSKTDAEVLVTALKNTTPEIQNRIFSNMSKRAVLMLKEGMEYMKPASVEESEEAKKKVVSVIRRLEETGEIVAVNYSDEEFV